MNRKLQEQSKYLPIWIPLTLSEMEDRVAGHGKKFNFHGAFTHKEAAVEKEKEVSGFIREKIIDGKTRYFVLTERK